MTTKVMFSLPDDLASRMRATIPARERSKVIAALFEKEIIARERSLYLCAKELENCAELKAEISAWDKAFGEDGLDNV